MRESWGKDGGSVEAGSVRWVGMIQKGYKGES